jgi:hypothetical protein
MNKNLKTVSRTSRQPRTRTSAQASYLANNYSQWLSRNWVQGYHAINLAIPKKFNFYLKLSVAMVLMLAFTYGFLVNKTVSVTAEYSQLESDLIQANNKLSSVTTRITNIEEQLRNSVGQYQGQTLQETEPTGFVSRDVSTVLSYQTD